MFILLKFSVQRGSAMIFSTSGFFHESVSPEPLSIPLGLFFFLKNSQRYLQLKVCTTGVVDTGGKGKKSSIRKVFNVFA
jgi:hypothetical protein